MGEIFKRAIPEKSLEWTGERLTTATAGQVEIEHLHRYFLARALCRGRDVLDVASGEGYGSALLAQTARSVVGVEVSPEAVSHAIQAYRQPNLRFLEGDARHLPIDDACVDAVVSFETIEHLYEHDQFLAEVRRVLRPGGRFIISSPERDIYSPSGTSANPYHVRELTRAEFGALLCGSFSNVQLLGQRPMLGSALVSEGNGAHLSLTFEKRGPTHFEATDGLPRPVYIVAVASDQPVADVPDSLYIETAEIGVVLAAANAAPAAAAEALALRAQLDATAKTEADTRGRLSAVEAAAAEARARVEALGAQLDTAVKTEADTRERLGAAEAAASQARARAEKTEAALRTAAAEDAEAARQAIAAARAEIAAAGAEIAAARAEIAAARAEAAAACSQRDIARMAARRAAAAAEGHWRSRMAESEAEATATMLSERRRHESEIAVLRHEVQAIVDSTIWRATAPLRAAAGKFPSALKPAARRGLRAIYWVLTPWKTRDRILVLRDRFQQRPQTAASDVATIDVPISPATDVSVSRPDVETRVDAPLVPATGSFSIVFVSGEPDTPGHQYRVERYAAAAAANGCTVIRMRADELPHRVNELSRADLLVIWRMPWNEHVDAAISQMRMRRKKVAFDIDDLMVDPDMAQVTIIDGIRTQALTEDQVRRYYAAVRETMLASDVCFAATDELALHMRMAGKVVHVLPNGFDNATHSLSRLAARQWRERRQDKLIRLGYAGGTRTHQRDLGVAIEAVARLLEEYPQCRLVLYRDREGVRPLVDIEEFPALVNLADRIEWRSFRPLSQLPEEMARFDINLAPLEFGNPYCEAKSQLKFFEAALVDVPTIASPTGPFRRSIEHGKTGFLAASTDDWYEYGKRLIEDPELRARIGREAYNEALARFGSTARNAQFGRVVAQLCGGAAAAHAFALDSQLAGSRISRPGIFSYETLFVRNGSSAADVTVVMPLYNYEKYVTEALESVREQTLSALDLVVVDDCSTDRSLSVVMDWVKKHARRFNRVCVVKNRSNSGLAASRNSGFDAADTPYVLPLDPDNKLLPQCCEILLYTIRATGAAFAYSTIQHFGEGEGLVSAVGYDGQRLVGGNYIDAMALVSKEAWATIGGYHHIEVVGWEDYDFWCRLAEHGLAGAWHSDVLALYRVHGTSMLRTHTMVPGNHRRLLEDFTTRHPWVSLMAEAQHFERPTPAVPASERPEFNRLRKLLPFLRCPETKQKLMLDETCSALLSVDGRRRWPIVEGRPVLSPQSSSPEIRSVDHLSNQLPDNATRLIRDATGLVLNLSAGGTVRKFEHVVEVEYAIFRHTDIVGDAHQLPFDDDSFELVVVMNAFEHYRDPATVATELHRILKPGGRILVHTAFLQPLHERPWHFFNCTRYGLEQWFKAFDTETLHVSDNFNPGHSVAWLASEAETALRSDVSGPSAEAFSAARFGQFAEMWRDPSKRTGPLWENFYRLSQPSQEVTAAGFEFVGRKPHRRSRG